jgi:hypothetical protein
MTNTEIIQRANERFLIENGKHKGKADDRQFSKRGTFLHI